MSAPRVHRGIRARQSGSAMVERDQLAGLQVRRHITVDDALRPTPSTIAVLPTTRSRSAPVVLGAAAEDLAGAPDSHRGRITG